MSLRTLQFPPDLPVAIVFHPDKPVAVDLSVDVRAFLNERAIEAHTFSARELDSITNPGDYSLTIVLGGDGSTLRAAATFAVANVPLFTINLGRVGFLAESTTKKWQGHLSELLDQGAFADSRFMLESRLIRAGVTVHTAICLNEATISRGDKPRLPTFSLEIDGGRKAQYVADSMVVATPTGSTAYSLSIGGPVVSPELDLFTIMPVAPHLSLSRPLVVSPDAPIKIKVETESDIYFWSDGNSPIPVQSGDELHIVRAPSRCVFARRSAHFPLIKALDEKLGLI